MRLAVIALAFLILLFPAAAWASSQALAILKTELIELSAARTFPRMSSSEDENAAVESFEEEQRKVLEKALPDLEADLAEVAASKSLIAIAEAHSEIQVYQFIDQAGDSAILEQSDLERALRGAKGGVALIFMVYPKSSGATITVRFALKEAPSFQQVIAYQERIMGCLGQ